MKNKIFYKLFSMTGLVVLLVLLIQFSFQYFFLEDYYRSSKENQMLKTINQLAKEITSNDYTTTEINELIDRYAIDNDMPIGMSNLYGSIEYGLYKDFSESSILITGSNGEFYNVSIDAFTGNSDFSTNIYENQMVTVEGYWDSIDGEMIYPSTIEIEGVQYGYGLELTELENATSIDNVGWTEAIELTELNAPYYYDDFDKVKGTISEVNYVENTLSGINYRNNLLIDEIYSTFSNVYDFDKFISTYGNNLSIKYDEQTNTENMYYTKLVTPKGKEPMIIFAASSLESISEATHVINQFSLILLLVAIVIATAITFVFSKKISRPLLTLNSVTKRMTELDFSGKCDITSNDEIGELASNINVLSNELDHALDALKITNVQLQEDIMLKEKMDEFRKRFIANSSHELKTPLTVLKGIVEGLTGGLYNRDDDEHFESILNEIDDMSKLVHDLLEISKIETGEVPLNLEIFQLSEVVLRVNDKVKILAKSKNVETQLNLSGDFIHADEEKIGKVITNLLNNALNYTPENGTVTINLAVENNQLHFYVENKPASIPEGDLEHIWEPFYRVEKSRNKMLGGTGLGLYLVKEIMEKHSFKYYIKNTDMGVEAGFVLTNCDEESVWF